MSVFIGFDDSFSRFKACFRPLLCFIPIIFNTIFISLFSCDGVFLRAIEWDTYDLNIIVVVELVDKGPFRILPNFFWVELVWHKVQEAPNKICDHNGDDDQSDDIVDVKNEVLLNNRLVITIFALERLEEFAKSWDVQQLDQTWKSEKTK